MAKEELQIIISAKDQASGILGGITSKLGILGKMGGGLATLAGAAVLGGITVAVGAATAGFAALAVGIKGAVGEAMEAQEVQTQLAQVIKSTGGAAGVTAEMINKMAESLALETRYGEEAIIGADNLLLTFTAIGKDIFPQVTEAVLDMSTAMGQDLKSSAIQIGKAMQDPITGAGALRRVGVQLTDEQEKMIKTMVEAGDVMGAQKMILAELTKEFGGSAKAAGKTFAGQMDILKNSLSEVSEEVGNVLLPYLTGGMQALVPIIKNVANTFASWFKSTTFQSWFSKLINWVVELAKKFNAFISGDKFKGWMKGIADFINGRLLPRLQEMGGWIGREFGSMMGKAGTFIKEILFPVLKDLWKWMATNLPRAIMTVVTFFNRSLLPALITIGKWIMDNVVPPLKVLWEWLEQKIANAIPVIGNWITQTLVPALIEMGKWIMANIVPALISLWNWLATNIPIAITVVGGWITGTLIPALKEAWIWFKENIIPVIIEVWNYLATNLPGAITTVSGWITGTLIPALKDAWTWFKENILPAITDVWNYLKTNLPQAITTVSGWITGTLVPALTDMYNWFSANILPAIKDVWNTITTELFPALQGLWNTLTGDGTKSTTDWGTILKDLAFIVGTTLKIAIDLAVISLNIIIGVVADGVKMVDNWIKSFNTLLDWIGKINSGLTNLKLPDWLTPGSPTPLELGLRGINAEIAKVSKLGSAMTFGSGMSFAGPQVSMAGGSAGGGTNMGGITVVYSPGMSLGSQAEFETQFIPLLTRALGKVNRGKV